MHFYVFEKILIIYKNFNYRQKPSFLKKKINA